MPALVSNEPEDIETLSVSVRELQGKFDGQNREGEEEDDSGGRMIDFDLLEEMPENEAVFGYDEEKIQEIMDSIESDTMIELPVVVPIDGGKYRILAGHQRIMAMKRLGWESCKCMIRRNLTPLQQRNYWRKSNTLKRTLTPYCMAQVVKTYAEDYTTYNMKGGKRKYIAKQTGISETQVRRYEFILTMPETIQKLCDDMEFPYTVLQEAAGFSDEQKELLAKLLEKRRKDHPNLIISPNELRGMIKKVIKDTTPAEYEDPVDMDSYEHFSGENSEAAKDIQDSSYQTYREKVVSEVPAPTGKAPVIDKDLTALAKNLFTLVSGEHLLVLNHIQARNDIKLIKEALRELEKKVKL